MSNDYKGIMVYAEIFKDEVVANSLELLGAARKLASDLGEVEVTAAVIGDDISKYADELYGYGADKVIACEKEMLKLYQPDTYSDVLKKIINKYKPEIVLIGATTRGEELAPTAALKLQTGLAAHCVDLRIDENKKLVSVVPAFGGKVLGDIYCPNSYPQMASVKAGLMEKAPYEGKLGQLEMFDCEVEGFGDKLKAVDMELHEITGKPLHEADVIIGGGFGIQNAENWAHLEELAEILKGATGCTRPALDEGWSQGEHTMIGTSGVAVRPKLYINFGISGAAHHTCGIKDSGTIVSVNKDPKSTMFAVSDYKAVCDGNKLIPLIIEKLRA